MKKLTIALLFGTGCALMAQHPKMDAALSDIVDGIAPVTSFLNTVPGGGPIQPNITASAQYDAQGRILVDIYLDGSLSMPQFTANLTALGAQITGINPYFRAGSLSAYVPVSALQSVAGTAGLSVVTMSAKPATNVGLVTSGGTKVIHSDTANANGFLGAGITVGVLSDSYNTSPTTFTTIRAANDIASGDLPTPKLVVDLPAAAGNTDEGRAMMQIVYDVAPSSSLCFETAQLGEASFAANIRDLRTNPLCAADVIVDDVFYLDEPFFSDGQVAQAANDVVTSNVLAGKKVAYFSSAGNQGNTTNGGSIDVPSAVFSTSPTGLGNINLATAATCTSSPATGSTKADVAGGWLDFGGGTFFKTVNYTASGSKMIMQWDDLFYSGAVTTDLNWYLFNSAGACVFTFASNNFTTDNGIEVPGLVGGASGAYRIMVGRTSAGTHQATRVRMVFLNGFTNASGAPTSPATFGHSAAANAVGVAAYVYTTTLPVLTPAFEAFSSPGPVTIAFDAAGNRLAVAETRKKPDIAAPDGVNTTFFFPGEDYEGDGFPNFFGTSAAAPHAAGVAALLLGKAGPGSLTAAQIKSILQTTAPARVPPVTGGAAVKGYLVYDGFGLISATAAIAKLP
jgi:Subtilase family